ncbi:Protein N-terminal and lysine N-methyltransferase efm7 [Coemansia sp. RSA 552]|nr:Protein N-terminal and lysine N-methyltransferase efm7 [Coemansia sp. RSA 552]
MSSNTSDQEDFEFGSMFQEPQGFRPPPPQERLEVFERAPANVEAGSPASVKVNLLGQHPLWGHHLWNAAKVFANYLDSHKDIVRDQTVVELGAAGALPSLVSALNGARRIVITDYPDSDLIANMRKNVELNRIPASQAVVEGHRWGNDIESIGRLSGSAQNTFDVLILCDLVFNHSEHNGLLKSVDQLMDRDHGVAYVFFTHHRPWLAARDMEFIDRARDELGLDVTRIVEEYTGPMFEEDPGDERVRGTVHGFRLGRSSA